MLKIKRLAVLAVAITVLGGAVGALIGMWLVPQPANAQGMVGDRCGRTLWHEGLIPGLYR